MRNSLTHCAVSVNPFFVIGNLWIAELVIREIPKISLLRTIYDIVPIL